MAKSLGSVKSIFTLRADQNDSRDLQHAAAKGAFSRRQDMVGRP